MNQINTTIPMDAAAIANQRWAEWQDAHAAWRADPFNPHLRSAAAAAFWAHNAAELALPRTPYMVDAFAPNDEPIDPAVGVEDDHEYMERRWDDEADLRDEYARLEPDLSGI